MNHEEQEQEEEEAFQRNHGKGRMVDHEYYSHNEGKRGGGRFSRESCPGGPRFYWLARNTTTTTLWCIKRVGCCVMVAATYF